ncbi:CDP-alcohol phosphatidyltransferase family protein [bacterium]|jgi:phosphatidylglycerophosphate synthase|nr:CDP-alcohol phosphatidyltransferase family protein [bacterium]MBT3850609.1 CDP-alcohol phosphatidyltransferase family protein [bacterium]MBT4434779.1 CDP-alcohol phosphatidyltransferase family protein [bacterium]MDG2445501.1 CDP-alcohol phosphatidyltransferase family protein [Thermodesulfobacteriota bacterium]
MIPIVLCNGLGVDSEPLKSFNNEEIANLKIYERTLLNLAQEGFDQAALVSDIDKIYFKRLRRKFPDFKIIQSRTFDHLVKENDLLIIQNNVVLNKKQLQSIFAIIQNTDRSFKTVSDSNDGVIFLKNGFAIELENNLTNLKKISENIDEFKLDDPPKKLSINELGTNVGRDFLFDHISKNVSGWFSKRVNSKISIPISKILIKVNIHPNIITFFVGLIGISCGFFYAWHMPLAGALILQLATILDRCDGEVARIKLKESVFGQWFDTALDQISYFSMFVGISMCMNNPKYFLFTYDHILYKQLSILNILLYLIFLTTILFFMLRRTKNGSLAYYPSEVDKIVPMKSRSFIYKAMSKCRFLLKREFFSPAMILVILIGYETATILTTVFLLGGLIHQTCDYAALRKKIDITY